MAITMMGDHDPLERAANVIEVARRHDVHRNLLMLLRRQAHRRSDLRAWPDAAGSMMKPVLQQFLLYPTASCAPAGRAGEDLLWRQLVLPSNVAPDRAWVSAFPVSSSENQRRLLRRPQPSRYPTL